MATRLETNEDVERAFGMSPATEEGVGDKPIPDFVFISDRPTKTIQLAYPFSVRGVEYREYTLRRLNAEQVAEVGQELRRTGDFASLYSILSGLPYIACKSMDADDAEKLAAEALGFMPAVLQATFR